MAGEVEAALWGAIIGGLIGILAMYMSNIWTDRRLEKTERRNVMKEVLSVLHQYFSEVNIGLNRFIQGELMTESDYPILPKLRDRYEHTIKVNSFWIEKDEGLAEKLNRLRIFYASAVSDILRNAERNKGRYDSKWWIKEQMLRTTTIETLIRNMG